MGILRKVAGHLNWPRRPGRRHLAAAHGQQPVLAPAGEAVHAARAQALPGQQARPDKGGVGPAAGHALDAGGIGQVDGRTIRESLFNPNTPVSSVPSVLEPKTFDHEVQKIRGVRPDMLVVGETTDKFDYSIARCCNPIPGDDVFGFETDSGLIIHRTNCPRAVDLMSNYGNRIVRAKWTDQLELAFLAGIRLKGSDRVGIVNDVTRIISTSLKVNMRSITVDANDGFFEGQIMVFVNDTAHLTKMIQRLRKVNGVLLVERFDS